MIKNLLTITALLLVTTELFAQNVVIRGVRLSGSGCLNSAANASITPDGQLLSLLFDNYSAEIGIGSQNPEPDPDKKRLPGINRYRCTVRNAVRDRRHRIPWVCGLTGFSLWFSQVYAGNRESNATINARSST